MARDIAESMNAHKFSLPFESFATPQPLVEMGKGDLDNLRCDVFAFEESGERSSRGSFQHSYKFRLGFRKKITVTSDDDVDAELDKVIVVAEEVLEFWKVRKPANGHGALVSFDTIIPFGLADVRKNRLAICELVLTFNGTRDNRSAS